MLKNSNNVLLIEKLITSGRESTRERHLVIGTSDHYLHYIRLMQNLKITSIHIDTLGHLSGKKPDRTIRVFTVVG